MKTRRWFESNRVLQKYAHVTPLATNEDKGNRMEDGGFESLRALQDNRPYPVPASTRLSVAEVQTGVQIPPGGPED